MAVTDPGGNAPRSSTERGVAGPVRLYPAVMLTLSAAIAVLAVASVVAVGTVGWSDVGLLVGFHLVAFTGVTVGHHRLFSHRSFKVGPAVRALIGIAAAMAAQGTIKSWASRHRQHHRHTDTDGDVHSPHAVPNPAWPLWRRLVFAHVTWLLHVPWRGPFPHVQDLEADPVVTVVDRLYPVWIALGIALAAGAGLLVHGGAEGALRGAVWGGVIRILVGLHLVSTVNSVGHAFGRRDFETRDESRNNLWLAVLTLGEGWHNSHHAFPGSARVGHFRGQPDAGFAVIRALERLGLAHDVRLPARERLLQKSLRRRG